LHIINKSCKTFTFDGSSHDSHQWQEIISVVDNNVLKYAWKIAQDYGLPKEVSALIHMAVTDDWF
jgi:hypothetical protein